MAAGRGAGAGTDSRTVTCDGPDGRRMVRLHRVHEPRAHDHQAGSLLERWELCAGLGSHAHGFREPSLDAHGDVRERGEAGEDVLDQRGGHGVDGGDARHADSAHVERCGDRARQQHVFGGRRHANICLHGRRHRRGADVHAPALGASVPVLRLTLAESHGAHHGRRFRQDGESVAKVTFNGSSVAVLQVGALTCNLDLVTGAVTGCH